MKASYFGFSPHYSEHEPSLEGNAMLEYGAPWYGHCIAALPAVQKILAEHSELLHIKVFDGKGKKLGHSFRVKL